MMSNSKIPEMFYSDSFETVNGIHINVKSFNNYQLHRHEFYEFEYVIEGEGQCEVNGKSFSFSRGDVLFVTPFDVHGYKSDNLFKMLTIHFRIDNLSNDLISLAESKACIMKSTKEMEETFMLLVTEYEETKKDDFKYMVYKNLLERIVILFMRSNKCSLKTNMPKEIIYAVGYINTNFHRKIDLQSVAEIANYSPEHFSRQFKKYTGLGFNQYLTNVRLSHAKNLLINKDISITQVCYESGFGSLRSLDRAFKNKFNCSPKKYKNQNLS